MSSPSFFRPSHLVDLSCLDADPFTRTGAYFVALDALMDDLLARVSDYAPFSLVIPGPEIVPLYLG